MATTSPKRPSLTAAVTVSSPTVSRGPWAKYRDVPDGSQARTKPTAAQQEQGTMLTIDTSLQLDKQQETLGDERLLATRTARHS
jgi:hypothetical protein